MSYTLVGAVHWYAAPIWVLALVIHGRRGRPLCKYVLRDTRYYEVRLLSVARFGKEELPAAIK